MSDIGLNILCDQDRWEHDIDDGFNIRFNQDGTGELLAVGPLGLGPIFFVDLQWRALPMSRTINDVINDQHFRHNNWLTTRPKVLGCLHLEITLLNRVPARLLANRDPGKWTFFTEDWNDHVLTEAAFLPKQFTAIIEQGNFRFYREWGECRSELRLTFDVAPWPTLDGLQWEGQKRSPPLTDMCECMHKTRSFYAKKLPSSALGSRATNNDELMGYKTSGCTMS